MTRKAWFWYSTAHIHYIHTPNDSICRSNMHRVDWCFKEDQSIPLEKNALKIANNCVVYTNNI